MNDAPASATGDDDRNTAAGPASAARSARPRRLVPILVAVIAAASLVSAWSGYGWWTAVHGEQAQIMRARDGAVEATAQALVNFHTLDHRNVHEGLDSWERSATGRFLDDLRKGRARDAQAVRDSKTSTVGRTVSASVLGVDPHAGKATAIGVVEIVVTPEQGTPVTKRDRVQVELARTSTGWKLTSLAPVPVGA